jgi:hypothetical protein
MKLGSTARTCLRLICRQTWSGQEQYSHASVERTSMPHPRPRVNLAMALEFCEPTRTVGRWTPVRSPRPSAGQLLLALSGFAWEYRSSPTPHGIQCGHVALDIGLPYVSRIRWLLNRACCQPGAALYASPGGSRPCFLISSSSARLTSFTCLPSLLM